MSNPALPTYQLIFTMHRDTKNKNARDKVQGNTSNFACGGIYIAYKDPKSIFLIIFKLKPLTSTI